MQLHSLHIAIAQLVAKEDYLVQLGSRTISEGTKNKNGPYGNFPLILANLRGRFARVVTKFPPSVLPKIKRKETRITLIRRIKSIAGRLIIFIYSMLTIRFISSVR